MADQDDLKDPNHAPEDPNHRTLTPLTIKAVVTAPKPTDDRIYIDGKPLMDVILYGTVKSIHKQTVNTVVMLLGIPLPIRSHSECYILVLNST